MMALLLGCGPNQLSFDGPPVDIRQVETALFIESNFSNPPTDGYGLMVLSSGSVSCDQLIEVDAYGIEWLAEQGEFTDRQSGLIIELRWLELGWEGAYLVGGTLLEEQGKRTSTLYAYQDGDVLGLSTDSGLVHLDVVGDSVIGAVDTLQTQARFEARSCGQASAVGSR